VLQHKRPSVTVCWFASAAVDKVVTVCNSRCNCESITGIRMSGDAFYYVLFAAFGLPVVALVWTQGIGGHSDINPAQRAFRNNYLLVWSLQMCK
jgi:hypothetical protein